MIIEAAVAALVVLVGVLVYRRNLGARDGAGAATLELGRALIWAGVFVLVMLVTLAQVPPALRALLR